MELNPWISQKFLPYSSVGDREGEGISSQRNIPKKIVIYDTNLKKYLIIISGKPPPPLPLCPRIEPVNFFLIVFNSLTF